MIARLCKRTCNSRLETFGKNLELQRGSFVHHYCFMEHSLTYFLIWILFFVICSTNDTSCFIAYHFFSFAFSSLMLQVSLNNGTTFVSSNVNITTKNCPKPENNGTTFVSCDVNVTTKNCTQPVKPNEEKEKEKEPTKVGYIVVFT